MIDWLIAASEKCRDIAQKSRDALSALEKKDADGAKLIQEYMKADYKALVGLWEQVDPNKSGAGRLSDMGRHIAFGKENDFTDILTHDLPDVQRKAEKLAKARHATTQEVGFEELLHPVIQDKCLPLYRDGHLRESVLNAVIAVYDMIRHRTQSTLDGNALAGQAFGLENGLLIFSEVNTETGQNDQKGFLQIFQGVYTGVRNVKSHSLTHDLDKMKAAQYLVMLSLLARRVDECKDR
ncbi:TIGR02391 family protein [Polaromonas sp. CT11-55]|uniref:TIGR02391 family protein n=1 Tax=Polaromonas sp. CT11-55 TaxID=3243045 RepID=UPI0039A45F86